MKKVLIAFLVLLCIAGAIGTGYFYMQTEAAKSEKDVLIQQNGQLQSSLDAIGPLTTAWTVLPDVAEVGSLIEDGDLVEVTVAKSSITDVTVIDKSKVVGQYYKINITPGTTITTDMVMTYDFAEDTVYEYDMTFANLPLGIAVGDYVDVILTFPYGQTFTVLKHKRVEQLVLTANTIKIYVTPAERALCVSAERDKMLWGSKGLSISLVKYVEPGVQNTTLAYYPVRKDMEGTVTLDPNIKNKKICINAALRDQMELMLQATTPEDAALLASGIISISTGVNTAAGFYVKDSNGSTSTSTGTNIGGADGTINLDDVTNSITELENVGSSIKNPGTDSSGNSATVTETEKDNSEGDTVFEGEDIIE